MAINLYCGNVLLYLAEIGLNVDTVSTYRNAIVIVITRLFCCYWHMKKYHIKKVDLSSPTGYYEASCLINLLTKGIKMAQTLFKVTGVTAENSDKIKEVGMAVADVKWVNVNGDNIVVTHEDSFDESAFIGAIQGADSAVSLSK